jgi:hypothetical protein
MIDEVTGYQYERASDALQVQVKVKLFLAEEINLSRRIMDTVWSLDDVDRFNSFASKVLGKSGYGVDLRIF